MVKCFNSNTSSLEAKRFKKGGGDDFIKLKTEILIKEYLHQFYI